MPKPLEQRTHKKKQSKSPRKIQKPMIPQGHLNQAQVLRKLRNQGIPVSKQGLVYWMRNQKNAWLREGLLKQDSQHPRKPLYFSPLAVQAIEHWAALQYLTGPLIQTGALIPIIDLAHRNNTTVSRIHHLAKNAIVVIGREGYASLPLAESMESFMVHRRQRFRPPPNRTQNQLIAQHWVQGIRIPPERRQSVFKQLSMHFDQPTKVFLQRTLPAMALELAKGGVEKIFAREIRVPASLRRVVPEGLVPEENVLKKLQKINPNVSLKQTRALLKAQMAKPKNKALFRGSYTENYGMRRIIVPIRAANRITEIFQSRIEAQSEKTSKPQKNIF